MDALNTNTAQAKFVGGCVRNALLGLPVTDIDIAINVVPETTIQLLTKAGIKAVPTGITHGTITAIVDPHNTYEITSLRCDLDTDGRHATIAYTTNWHTDARRRDFTINSLYANRLGYIFDYTNQGMTDLENRIVRFIGIPVQRIQEDYLRILRYYRFHAYYATGEGEAHARAACSQHITDTGFKKVAKERITQEIRKILQAPYPSSTLMMMKDDKILDQIFSSYDVHNQIDCVLSWVHRLALLTYDITSLRLTKREVNKFNTFRQLCKVFYKRSCHGINALAYLYGALAVADILRVENISFSLEELKQATRKSCPVTAQDFINIGYGEGIELGRKIRYAQDIWLESNLTATKLEIMAKIVGHP